MSMESEVAIDSEEIFPLAQRVREAVEWLPDRSTLTIDGVDDGVGPVTVIDEGLRVVVVDGSDLGWTRNDTVARAARGEVAVILVGIPPEGFQQATAWGAFDVVDERAPPEKLALSIRNALEFQRLRRQVGESHRSERRYRDEARTLIETARALSQERDIRKLLTLILEKCRHMAVADAGSIYVVEGNDPDVEKRFLRFKLSQNDSVSFPTGGEFVLPVSKGSIAGSVVISKRITAIEDVYNLPSDAPFAFDPSFDAKVGYRTRSVLAVPLISAEDEVIGVVQLINKKRDPEARLRSIEDVERQVVPFDERSVELVASLAALAGVALENAMLYEENRRMLDGFVRASVQAIEQRDLTTSGHSVRVSVLSCRLAEAVDRTDTGPYKHVRFSPQELLELEYAALLHDFGKIGVREQVLVKSKKLYDWQLRLIRSRFDYLHKALEAEIVARKAELYKRNAPSSEFEDLDREWARRAGQIEGFWDIIREANEPTVLPQETSSRVRDLGTLTYVDPRGGVHPWLTTEEIKSLEVARGSLTPEEIEEIRSHVVHTYEFLSRIPWGSAFARVPIIAGCHHEKLNGKGYPRGLRGEEIPVGSRIMAIADIFDALTAADRPYKKAVPLEKALNILDLEVQDGGLDAELVRIFVNAQVYRALDEIRER